MKFWVDGIPSLPNTTRGQHWSKTYNEKGEWEDRIGWYARAAQIKPVTGRAQVSFLIQVASERRVDPDNLMWAVTKPVMDSLQKLGILKDDSIDDVELSYAFSRAKPRGFMVSIEPLEGLDDLG